MNLTTPFLGLARWVWGLILLALVALAAWWAVSTLMSGATARTEAKLGRNQTAAAIASGADAVGTLGAQAAAETAIDRQTKENADAIRSAAGADTPVPAAVDAVARQRLCRRAIYSQRPECMQFAPSR